MSRRRGNWKLGPGGSGVKDWRSKWRGKGPFYQRDRDILAKILKKSTQTYCSGIMAQVYFLLLRGTMVDVANFLDVYTDSILQFLVLLMLSWPCRKCNFR